MSSSDYDTYSNLHAKSAFLSEAGIRYHLDSDDSKTVTLKATPSQAGNVDLTLPTSAGALLSDQSNLNGAKLSDGSVATAALADDSVNADKISFHDATDIGAGLHNADSFLVSDSDNANAVKRVTGAALKMFCGGSLSAGDIDNSNLFAANVVDTAAIANDAVTEFKIGANQVKDTHIVSAGTAGTAGATKFVKLDANKDIAGLNDVGCATVEAQTSLEAPIVYLGDNQWRMKVAGGHLVFENWNGSAWAQGHQIDAVSGGGGGGS